MASHHKSIFALHGIPEVVLLDKSLQFFSSKLAKFAQEYGFTHEGRMPELARLA